MKAFEAIKSHPRSRYEDNGIDLIAAGSVVGIDREARVVTGALGTTRPYDMLLATGSNPVIIPLPGHRLPGAIGFRDIGLPKRKFGDIEKLIGSFLFFLPLRGRCRGVGAALRIERLR